MSTSLLYHALGVRGGYQYVRTEYAEGAVIMSIEQPREQLRCAACGSADVHVKTHEERMFRTVPIGRRPVWIHFPVPRVECQHCGLSRQVKLGFAEPRVSYTRSFERYALDLGRLMTIQDVATHLGVGWDTIKEMQRRSLTRQFARPKLRHVRRIAIDEVHQGRHGGFLTLVLDLDSGAVIFVGNGKGAEALLPFWRRLRSSRARIGAVATDMGQAYINAVRRHLPQATHVFDHFHVIKLYNQKLSELRRALYHEATQMHQQVLKGIRWLLLKNPENLDDQRGERERLQEALDLNRTLALAYYMKDDLRRLWQQANKRAANAFLNDWIRRADASGVKMLKQFARTLALHRRGLLAWYDHPISTGPLEATNNKLQLMKRLAYGYRDAEFFRLKIYALHQTKYALVG